MAYLDGSSNSATKGHDAATGRFLPGNRGEYHVRHERIQATLKGLIRSFRPNNDGDRALLALAAVHMDAAVTARTSTKRTRESNAARRLLDRVPRPKPSLEI